MTGHVDGADETVTGITGESLIINCKYPLETDKKKKRRFCNQQDKCAVKREAQSDLWTDGERFSMYDNTSVGLLSVMIRNLTKNDEGTYTCKVDKKQFLELEVSVEHGENDDFVHFKHIEHNSFNNIIIYISGLQTPAVGNHKIKLVL